MDTNFWGVVHLTRAVLPHLRRQGAGHFIQITSIGGRLRCPASSSRPLFSDAGNIPGLDFEGKAPYGFAASVVDIKTGRVGCS
jgi:NAD(P)-dependent dehydrogenase (short-subunit alcohol dehydrogenase family)